MGADTYYLKNMSNRRFATALDGSAANKARVGLATRNNSTSQRWTLEPAEGGYYRIINQHSNMVMGNGGRTESVAAIVQVVKSTGDGQLWRLEDAGSGGKRIINKLSGRALCISRADIGKAEAPLIQYDYGNEIHFWWYLLPA